MPCSRAPRRGIKGGESGVHSLPPPHLQSPPDLRPLAYESDSLTIRPQLPAYITVLNFGVIIHPSLLVVKAAFSCSKNAVKTVIL